MPTQFRWPEVWHDLALAREVAAQRPKKPADWTEIAERLSCAFSASGRLKVDLKGRGCRERLDRLVGKFRSEESKSLKRLVRYGRIACIEWAARCMDIL